MDKNDIKAIFKFEIAAVDKTTGKPKVAEITAPSRKVAEDFVEGMASNWIVVRKTAHS
tara:strand:+ start:496 stop:669 length:174 start_codon:yes stop_codon:yes gene_type:complete